MFEDKKIGYDSPNIEDVWLFRPVDLPCTQEYFYDDNDVDGGKTNSVSRFRDVKLIKCGGKLLYVMVTPLE